MRRASLFMLTAAAAALAATDALAQARPDGPREAVHRLRISEPACLDERGLERDRESGRGEDPLRVRSTRHVAENPCTKSDRIIGDPNGVWWIRYNEDASGRTIQMWGLGTDGRYWIREGDPPLTDCAEAPAQTAPQRDPALE